MKFNGIYPIATFGAGFYAGYNEGKGIDIGNIKYIAEYGPTLFSITSSLLITKLMKSSSKYIHKKSKDGDFKIKLNDSKVNYKNLDRNLKEKFDNSINKLEKQAKKISYFNSALKSGSITAILSFTGYAAGKFTSQFN